MRASLVDNRYRIEGQIGNDAIGTIYYAVDERTGADLAIKRLTDNSDSASEKRELLLAREYYLLVQFAGPNVVRAYDYGEDNHGPYYTCEVLNGPRLSDLSTPIPYLDVCRYLYELSMTLSAFHDRRIILRNLCPETVIVSRDGRVKLCDMSHHATFGVRGAAPIPLSYVAPEAIRGEPSDQSTDLFSLGAIAYNLLTGRDAYSGENLNTLIDSWRTFVLGPSSIEKAIPCEVDPLVTSLLSLSRASRPLAAGDIALRLQSLFGFGPDRSIKPIKGHLLRSKYLGREREQNRLRARMQRLTRSTSGGAKLIEGGNGLGKTRMLSEMLLDAQVMGLRAILIDIPFHRDTTDMLESVSAAVYRAFAKNALEEPEVSVPLPPVRPQKKLDTTESHRGYPSPTSLCLGLEQTENRIREITALQQWLFDQSQQKPLLLLVDDLQRADYDTVAFLLGLARQVHEHRILLLITINTDEVPVAGSSVQSLRAICDQYKLRNLSRDKTRELLFSMLDDESDISQLTERLYEASEGNPLKCVELIRNLVDRQILNRDANSWKLLSDSWDKSSCWELDSIYKRQIDEIGASDRGIIEALGVYQGELPLKTIKDLVDSDDLESFFSLLDDLVAKGILVGTGNVYRLSRAVPRQSLCLSLSAERLSVIHNRLGRVLEGARREVPLQASWHLVRGGKIAEGEAILMDFLARRFREGQGVQSTIGSLEDLLDIRKEKDDGDDNKCLPILFALVAAGYAVDRDISGEYATRAFEALLRRASTDKIRCFSANGLVNPSAMDPDRMLLCVSLIAAQTAYNNYDTVLLKRVVQELKDRFGSKRIEPTENESAFLHRIPYRIVVRYCRGLIEHDAGNVTEACRRLDGLIEALSAEPSTLGLDTASVQKIQLDAIFTRGLLSCLRIDEEALKYVERLALMSSRVAISASTDLQTMYRYSRGETDQVEDESGHVDLRESRLSTKNRIDRRLIEVKLPATALLRDSRAVNTIADQLRGKAQSDSKLVAYHQAVLGIVSALEKRSTEAMSFFDSNASICQPRSHVLWGVFAGYRAVALNQLQKYEEAKELCEESLQHVAEDRKNAPLHFFELKLQLAVAEACLGRSVDAEKYLEKLLATPPKRRHALLSSAVYATRAEIAVFTKKADEFVRNFEALWEIVRITGNQAILNRASDLRRSAVETGLTIHSASWGNSTVETWARSEEQ